MIKWQRDKNTFARRIVHSDFKKLLQKDFIIEQGTKGIIFENGKLQEIVSCGKIKSNSNILSRLLNLDFTRNIEVVVCEAGEIRLAYLYGEKNSITEDFKSPLYTKDEFPLQVGIEIALQLHSPELFMLNIFKGINELPVLELKIRYLETIQNQLAKFVCKHNIVSFGNIPDLKNRCCDELEQNIFSIFQHDGFELVNIRSVTFYNPDFERLKEQKVSLKIEGAYQILKYRNRKQELEDREKWIQLKHKENELQITQSLMDKKDELEQQKIDDDIAGKKFKHKLEIYEAQVELWDKLRNYKNQEEMKKITSREELEVFIDKIDTQKIMRKEQKEKLLREFNEQNEDHKQDRAFIAAHAEMEHQYALKSMELIKNQDLSDQELEFKIKQEHKLMEHELNKKKLALSSELELQKIREIESIQSQSRQIFADMQKRKHDPEFEARSKAKIAQINMQVQKQRAEVALSIKEKSLAELEKDTKYVLKDKFKLKPEEKMKALVRNLLEEGEFTEEKQNMLINACKNLNLAPKTFQRIYEEKKKELNFGKSNNIVLTIIPKVIFKSGKTSLLTFCLHNSNMEYEKATLKIMTASYNDKVLETDFGTRLLPHKQYKCFIPYTAPKNWTEDVITKLYIYLYENKNNPVVYQGAAHITLPITDTNEQKNLAIQVNDYAQIMGDIFKKGSTEYDQETREEIPIELYYDADKTEKLQKEPIESIITEIKANVPLFNTCYLEIKENDKIRYVYLIAKQQVILGRFSGCDIQVCALDESENPVMQLCSLISKQHCMIKYQANRILIEDTGTSQNHNPTQIVNLNKQLLPHQTHCLGNDDIIKIGSLKFKVTQFFNRSKPIQLVTSKISAEKLYSNSELLWKNYGGYNTPGDYSSLRLNYLNNPYLKEQYILLYKYARFGSAVKIPITLTGSLPPVAGRFRFEQGYLYVENIDKHFKKLYINDCQIPQYTPFMLKPNDKIKVGKVEMILRLD